MLYKNNFINLDLTSGSGGNGIIISKTRKLKNRMSKGGAGGKIYIFYDKFLKKNLNFQYLKNSLKSSNGCKAKSIWKNGKGGKNLILRIPLNSTLINLLNNKFLKIRNLDKKFIFIKSSASGISKTKILKYKTWGAKGVFRSIALLIKNKIDFMLIGFFNSGKSSFLFNFYKKKKYKISFYNKSTKNSFLYNLKSNLFNFSILENSNLTFDKNYKINFYRKYIKIKKIIYIIDFFYLNKINLNFKFLNKITYYFNKIFYYKPRILIFNKIDLFKKNNFLWFFKNFNFINIFNWKNIIFFNTIFIKKNYLKIFKHFI
ncbi:hypothetical protein QUR95_00375 [Candidatus Nasuia deltocephalinicola]|nr:hypothetical protein QUR95_00375 [Candidatus Nasuia deltocephalinicola]